MANLSPETLREMLSIIREARNDLKKLRDTASMISSSLSKPEELNLKKKAIIPLSLEGDESVLLKLPNVCEVVDGRNHQMLARNVSGGREMSRNFENPLSNFVEHMVGQKQQEVSGIENPKMEWYNDGFGLQAPLSTSSVTSPLPKKPPDPPDMILGKSRNKGTIFPKYSCEDIYERMEMGLCVFCEEFDTPGHYQLKHKRSKIFMTECVDNLVSYDKVDSEAVVEETTSDDKMSLEQQTIPSTTSRVHATQSQGIESNDEQALDTTGQLNLSGEMTTLRLVDSGVMIVNAAGGVMDVTLSFTDCKSSELIDRKFSRQRSGQFTEPLSMKSVDYAINVNNSGPRAWEPGGLSAKAVQCYWREKQYSQDGMLQVTQKLHRTEVQVLSCLQEIGVRSKLDNVVKLFVGMNFHSMKFEAAVEIYLWTQHDSSRLILHNALKIKRLHKVDSFLCFDRMVSETMDFDGASVRNLLTKQSRNCSFFEFVLQWKWYPPKLSCQACSGWFLRLWTWQKRVRFFSSRWLIFGERVTSPSCIQGQRCTKLTQPHVDIVICISKEMTPVMNTWSFDDSFLVTEKHKYNGNGATLKLSYLIRGYGDRDIMKLQIICIYIMSLLLFYGSLPRPPEFRKIKKSLERLILLEDHKLLFSKTHKPTHSGAGFSTLYNNLEQMMIELQSCSEYKLLEDAAVIRFSALRHGHVENSFAEFHAYEVFHLQRPPEVLAEIIYWAKQKTWSRLLNGVEKNGLKDIAAVVYYGLLLSHVYHRWKNKVGDAVSGLVMFHLVVLTGSSSNFAGLSIATVIHSTFPKTGDLFKVTMFLEGAKMGLGFVVLEGDRKCLMGLQNWTKAPSPLHAEAEGLVWAMKAMIRQGKRTMHFETDCAQLVSVIQNSEDWPAMASVVEDINIESLLFECFSIAYIPRGMNQRADCLAKAARARIEPLDCICVETPVWLAHVASLLE
ncbi:hypothetical protein IGI04_032034 [Brassica rapa subsp. trilocularis]|uniref:RNase H type-1 domain-containing protein n=1 Tax=Brassica rapa subsp. trilocularis TaxID=1813537 RepID=A0ABQ7LXU3_BRACM|nr:hypothetical protein IGI04_032034 [Brassica rapa subsp. trilocularis]